MNGNPSCCEIVNPETQKSWSRPNGNKPKFLGSGSELLLRTKRREEGIRGLHDRRSRLYDVPNSFLANPGRPQPGEATAVNVAVKKCQSRRAHWRLVS